jgi:hypothetical protein
MAKFNFNFNGNGNGNGNSENLNADLLLLIKTKSSNKNHIGKLAVPLRQLKRSNLNNRVYFINTIYVI